jgi:hypothetical protein
MDRDTRETRFYWANWYWMNDEDTIFIKGSIYTRDEHISTFFEVPKDNESHGFCLWVLDQPEYDRILDEQDLIQARDRLDLESNLK